MINPIDEFYLLTAYVGKQFLQRGLLAVASPLSSAPPARPPIPKKYHARPQKVLAMAEKSDERITMKKFITLLISCSLTLAATSIAQQDEEQGKVKKKDQTEKSQPANEAKPAPKPKLAPKEHAQPKTHGQQTGEMNTEPNALKTRGKDKVGPKAESTESAPKMHDMTRGAGKEPANADATVTGQEHGMKGKKEHAVHTESAITNKPAGPTTGVGANAESLGSGAVEASKANPNANVKVNVDKVNARGGKMPDIQTIKTQHASFRAQPRPDKVPTVTFSQSYRISGSDQWQGEKYAAYRSYHPERHDQGWYHSHYPRVELIGGGYYYWNGGYWYPAWGYDSSAEYYAYDGPVYVGSNAEPPDRVIADVQGALQEMGYYHGEVDGLLGPMTREALTTYQADNGLYPTATIDEPTMESLGMG